MSNQAIGQLLLLVCCGAPFLAGFLAAWAIYPNVKQYGFPAGLVPGFIRRLFHRLLDWINTNEEE